jgi:hypothetical protein
VWVEGIPILLLLWGGVGCWVVGMRNWRVLLLLLLLMLLSVLLLLLSMSVGWLMCVWVVHL